MPEFNSKCQACPRLASHLKDIRRQFPDYYARPVPSFGDKNPVLLIVGLAPGMHGANASGRPFTGDYAGILLYETLHKYGFSNKPTSEHVKDGLILQDCRITNAVRCLPPQNKPVGAEVNNCNDYLRAELEQLPAGAVVLALGSLAHNAILKASAVRKADCKFGHGSDYALPGELRLLSSYHCSRYNTNTRRLTPEMFAAVFAAARQHLDNG